MTFGHYTSLKIALWRMLEICHLFSSEPASLCCVIEQSADQHPPNSCFLHLTYSTGKSKTWKTDEPRSFAPRIRYLHWYNATVFCPNFEVVHLLGSKSFCTQTFLFLSTDLSICVFCRPLFHTYQPQFSRSSFLGHSVSHSDFQMITFEADSG